MRLIDGYYDKEEGSFAPTDLIQFEYASVQDTRYHKLIPEASSGGYGATCHKCNKDVDSTFYDTINDYYDLETDTGKEKDMRELELVCEHCKTKQTLVQLVFNEPVVFANQYFQFVNIFNYIDPKFVDIFKEKLECEVKLIYEKM